MDEFVMNGHTIKETKRTLSHLSLISREWERGGRAVKATTAECIMSVVVSHPLRSEHTLHKAEKQKQKARSKN